MNLTVRIWLRRTAIGLVVLAILYFVGQQLLQLVGRAIGILMFLVNVLFLPALLVVLSWFVYSVFLKRYLRARRISRIRNDRYLKEAVQRGDSEGHSEEPTNGLGEDRDSSLRSE